MSAVHGAASTSNLLKLGKNKSLVLECKSSFQIGLLYTPLCRICRVLSALVNQKEKHSLYNFALSNNNNNNNSNNNKNKNKIKNNNLYFFQDKKTYLTCKLQTYKIEKS